MHRANPGKYTRRIIISLGFISATILVLFFAAMYLIAVVEKDSGVIHREVVPDLVSLQSAKLDLMLARQSLSILEARAFSDRSNEVQGDPISLAQKASELIERNRDVVFDERLGRRATEVFKSTITALQEFEAIRQRVRATHEDVTGVLDRLGQNLIDLINTMPTDSPRDAASLISGAANQADAVLQLGYQSLDSLARAENTNEVEVTLNSLNKSVYDAFLWIQRNRVSVDHVFPGVFDTSIEPLFERLRSLIKPDGQLHKLHLQRVLARDQSQALVLLSLDYEASIEAQLTDRTTELQLLRNRLMAELETSFTFSKWGIVVLSFVLMVIVMLISRYMTESVISSRRLLERKITERTLDLENSKDSLMLALNKERRTQAELLEKQTELYQANQALSKSLQQLKRTQVLMTQQEKLASIGHLAAGVAHEINNPLGFILSNINRLNEYINDLIAIVEQSRSWLNADEMETVSAFAARLTEALERYDYEFIKDDLPSLIEDCVEGGGRVKEIIQNLKDFSRADNSRDTFEHKNLRKLLEKTLNLLKNETKYNSRVELVCPSQIELDLLPGPFSQVVSNLVINAVHAIKKVGREGLISIVVTDSPESIFIKFSDNGCGIAKEHIGRIFDPFFTTKKVGEGTGLGMNIAYDIIANRHGGHIEVVSEEGTGTEFRIRLPRQQLLLEQEALSA
jgi:two-component system, NtrC family, sensor kinase